MKNARNLPLLISLMAVMGISYRQVVNVEGFSVGSRGALSTPAPRLSLKTSRVSSSPISSRQPRLLKAQPANSDYDNLEVHKYAINRFRGMFKRAANQGTTQVIRFWLKSRRSVLSLCAVMVFWFGAAGVHTSVSHGSSTSTDGGVISRNSLFSNSFDQMVDQYVKGHMFDDDAYDPVESIYKEAMDDRLKGTYPRDLKETTSSVLGQNVVKAEKKSSDTGFSGGLMKTVSFLRKQGLSEMQAIALMTGVFVIGFPSIALLVVMQIGFQSKRSMNKLMKERYGDTYTVDASEKKEEDVDIPDDDDDDDE